MGDIYNIKNKNKQYPLFDNDKDMPKTHPEIIEKYSKLDNDQHLYNQIRSSQIQKNNIIDNAEYDISGDFEYSDHPPKKLNSLEKANMSKLEETIQSLKKILHDRGYVAELKRGRRTYDGKTNLPYKAVNNVTGKILKSLGPIAALLSIPMSSDASEVLDPVGSESMDYDKSMEDPMSDEYKKRINRMGAGQGVLAPEPQRNPSGNWLQDLIYGADEESEMEPTRTALRPLHEQIAAPQQTPPTPDEIRARRRMEVENKLKLKNRR